MDVLAELAEELSERPLVVQVEVELEGHVEYRDEHVADGQRQQEHVRDSAHLLVTPYHDDDERVADDGQRHDGDIGDHEQRLDRVRQLRGQHVLGGQPGQHLAVVVVVGVVIESGGVAV